MHKARLSRSMSVSRLAMVMSFAGTSVLNYLFGIATGWLLAPGDYGLIGFAQTIILICSLILNSGLAWSLTARIASTDKRETWGDLVRGSLVLNLGLSLILVFAILLLFQIGLLQTGLETWQVASTVAFSLPFISVIAIVSGTLRGTQSFGNLATLLVLEVLLKTVSGILLVALGYGAVGALFGFSFGGAVAALIGIWQVRRVIGLRFRGRMTFLSLRVTGDMFVALISMALLLNIDIIFVKLFTGDQREISGYYQSATMLANIPYYLATAIFSVMFSQIAKQESIPKSTMLIANNLRIVLLFFVPISIGFAVAPDQVLGLIFPAAYITAAPILRILSVGNILLILTGLLSTTFQASQKALIPAIILGLVVILEIFALAAVVPTTYMLGASIVFAVACAFALLGQFFIFQHFIPDIPWKYLLKWVSRYLLCIAVAILTYVVCMAGIGLFLVSVSVAGVVYLSALHIVGLQQLPLPFRQPLSRASSEI